MSEHFKLIPAVHLFLIKGDEILMLRRFNTGYEDGNYSLVAGHVEAEEAPVKAMCREAMEEAGIDIKPEDLEFAHVMYRMSEAERVDFFFVAKTWQGMPTNKEPDKCDDLSWFSIDSLPSNTIPYVRHAIQQYNMGKFFTEFGW